MSKSDSADMLKAPRCSAHKTNGDPCKNPAMVGLKVCASHGGYAPRARQKSAVAKVEREMEKFARPVDDSHPLADPVAGLNVEYRRTIARLEWLQERIARLRERQLTWGKTKTEHIGASETPGTNETFEARIHPYLELEDRERKHLLAIEKLLADNAFKGAELALQQKAIDFAYAKVMDIVVALGRKPDDPRVARALARVFGGDRALPKGIGQPMRTAKPSGHA